jgi:hypothetical protein
MGRLRTFLSLRLGDQLRLLAASCLLLLVWGGVVILPFDWFRRQITRFGNLGGKFSIGSPSAARIAHTVDIADKHLPGGRTCLVRSLSTEVLLRLYNRKFTHRIGVDRTAEGSVRAHSWIEHDGEVLIGQLENLDAFEPLPPLENTETIEW